MNYCAESIAFINEAYSLLNAAKDHPENFTPYKYRPLAYPYCLVLSKDNWKLTLCTRTVDTPCIFRDNATWETVYTLNDNHQVHELLGVYVDCLRKMEEDSKKNGYDYCKAAVEFTSAACRLLDICRDPGAGDVVCLSDGNHVLSLHSRCHELVLYYCKHKMGNGIEKGINPNNWQHLGVLYLNDDLDISKLLAKYLDSLKEHAHEL